MNKFSSIFSTVTGDLIILGLAAIYTLQLADFAGAL
jgi:hypothetical protein